MAGGWKGIAHFGRLEVRVADEPDARAAKNEGKSLRVLRVLPSHYLQAHVVLCLCAVE